MQLRHMLAAAALLAGPLVLPAAEPRDADSARFLENLRDTHRVDEYYGHDMVKAHMVVTFDGNERINGPVYFDAPLGVARIEHSDGSVLVFDGEKAWQTPDTTVSNARFHLITWPYFLITPFKVGDPSVNLESSGEMPFMNGEDMRATVKMTFDAGTGDTPDDWYVLYKDEQGRLEAMSYIVTYYGSDEPEPHAIHYGGYETVDGVPFSTEWTFYNWSEEQGMYGDPIGHVAVSDIEFVPYDASLFEKPVGAEEAPLPE